jgi:hypothetical protein
VREKSITNIREKMKRGKKSKIRRRRRRRLSRLLPIALISSSKLGTVTYSMVLRSERKFCMNSASVAFKSECCIMVKTPTSDVRIDLKKRQEEEENKKRRYRTN